MPFHNYEMVLSSAWTTTRDIDLIVADMQTPAQTELQLQMMQIELAIAEGDRLARGRKYDPALKKFKEARALIYKILYPPFDVPYYVNDRVGHILPATAELENSLLQATAAILDMNRPSHVPTAPPVGVQAPPIGREVALYAREGYREIVAGDEAVQRASEQALALMSQGKAQTATALLESTLQDVQEQEVDPALLGALTLNLSAAQLQAGQSERALETTQLSRRHFLVSGDTIGEAQALHLGGVSYQQLGNHDQAQELFQAAADILYGEQNLRANGATAALPTTFELPTLPRPGSIIIRPGDEVVVDHDLDSLQPIADMEGGAVSYRLPGRDEAWGMLPLLGEADRKRVNKDWQVSVPIGQNLASFTIGGSAQVTPVDLLEGVYARRRDAQRFADVELTLPGPTSTAFYLMHLYSYALLLKIGDMYHQLGQYAQAQANYLTAANYSHLNLTVEANILWLRIARNALEWGHALYKQEDLPAAREQYEKLITTDAHVPASFLYETAALKNPADAARTLIENLMARPLPEVNWEIATNVLTAFEYLQQILDGLDFYALTLSPIHTFEYLQSVARGFAQQAVQSEREFVTFKMREEAEAATRRDLEATSAMAQAEAEARLQQWLGAQEDESAAQNALTLATQRRNNAVDQRNAYQAASSAQIWAQAAAQAQGMGEDSWYGEISELADKLARGESISGPRGKLAAAYTLWAGRKTQAYELEKMQDNINELTQAITVAQDQLDSARRRTAAAEIAYQAALQRVQFAAAALQAFDDEFFTPDTWNQMAGVMRDIASSYLFRAIRIAKLMERAYNFENDTELKIVKNDYGHGLANAGPDEDSRLLGGDSLLQDVDSFTYHAITNKTRKSSRIKDVISVSADFPAQFQEFLNTGLLSLETDLYEFDRRHPGTFAQRIEAVEVQFIGALPEGGVNGTLTIGGVTRYRRRDGTTAERVHQVDTMALSEYILRNDAFVYQAETGVRGLFQGFGVGATWQLHLPRRGNNFDFTRIFDVQLVIYYTAMYDQELRANVLNRPLRPDELATLTTYSLRYTFPDAWYAYYQHGAAQFTLTRFQMPANQHNFTINAVYFRVQPAPGVDPAGIDLRVAGPNGVDGVVTTDAEGVISTDDAAIAGLIGADPLAEWQVAVVGGAPVMDNGSVRPDRVYNVQVGLEYSFEYLPEAI